MRTGSQPAGEDVAGRFDTRIRFDIRKPAIAVLAAFAVSRLAAYVAGVRFESSFLQSGWQLLDLRWLREDLVGSLAALHSQPPLFNLTIGLLAVGVPGYEHVGMQAMYLLLGAMLAFIMLDLLRRLGVSSNVAVAATLLVVVSPATLLYENWLFYPYPVAVMLVLAAWALCRYAVSRTLRSGLLAFALMAVPALTWSLFHVAWLIAAVVLVTVFSGVEPRKTLAAAACPLLLVLSWYGKNALLFGEPVASTWFGQNLYRAATGGLSADQRRQLAADLGLSPLATIAPFSPLASYRPYAEMPEPTGEAALDESHKQDGTPNFNHLAYIAISARYLELAVEIIKRQPFQYVQTAGKGLCRFCLPSTQDGFLEANRGRIEWVDRLYGAAIHGQLRRPPLDSDCDDWSPTHFPVVVPFLLLASIAGPVWLLREHRVTPDLGITLAFTLLTVAWVLLAGTLFEFGENNRFRYVTEPLMFVALAVSVQRAWDAAPSRRSPPRAYGPTPEGRCVISPDPSRDRAS